MTWAASAITEPVPSIDDGPLNADAPSMVLHTAVSNASDLKSFWQSGAAGPGVGSHFYVNKDGTIYEYVALERKTGHAFSANEFAWGLESWDGGLVIPWNAAQLTAIINLCNELKVPARALPENGKGGGVGFHREYAAWNLNAHTCPGDLRVAQVPGIIQAIGGDMTDSYGDMLAKAGLGIGDAAGNENYVTGWRFARRGIPVTDPLWIAHKDSPDFTRGYADGVSYGSGGGAALPDHAHEGGTTGGVQP